MSTTTLGTNKRFVLSRGIRLAVVLSAIWTTGCDGCGEAPAGSEFDVTFIDTGIESCGDEFCGAGEICSLDRCTVECAQDADCLNAGLDDNRCTNDGYCRAESPDSDSLLSTLCIVDDDCPSRSCDIGRCDEARGCINSDECFNDEICSLEGACVPGCTGDRECPDDELCINGGCLAADACDDDTDCDGGPCLSGACEGPCLVDPGTSDLDGEYCGRDGTCTGGSCTPRCSYDEDCAEGYCVRGNCQETPGEISDPNSSDPDDPDMGVDVDDTGNPDDRVPECYTNTDCDEDTARCEDARCVPYDICQSDLDCYDGTYCHRGQCRTYCEVDAHCRGEEICEDNRCVDEDEDRACRSTEECEPCESCIFGVCTVSEFFCREDTDCGFDKLCRNGFCTFECGGASDCPTGQSCIDLVCLDDPPLENQCVFNVDCSSEYLCINGRCHTECETHSECGARMMCDHGVCQPDRRPGAECLLAAHCDDERASCVDGHCALPCREDGDCATNACETGFCTR